MTENKSARAANPADGLSTFFVIASPGLEAIVRREFASWLPDVACGPLEKGGFEFRASLEKGCAANLVLKTPTRLLLRLADFGCRDFPKLFKKIRGFDWTPYFAPGSGCRVEVSTHGSRLKIKKRIESTVLDGLKAAGFAKALATELDPALYVRVVDDVCHVSLDTSGGILHKRGDRKETPDAPLRESFAAALLWSLADGASDAVTLVDPMMGSGTFLTEAKSLGQSVTSRDFAFAQFPVLKNFDAQATTAKFPIPSITDVFQKMLGFEQDAETAKIARKRVGAENVIEEDFFDSVMQLAPDHRPGQAVGETWLICNPPYGRRIKVDEPLTAYYGRLFQACEDKVRPARAGFIIPQTAHIDRIKRPRGWVLKSKLPFSNGGIAVTFYTFARRAD